MKRLFGWLLRRWLAARVHGDTSALSGRRVLIVANHASRLDPLLLGLCLPVAPLVVFPREDKRGPWLRLLLSFVDHRRGAILRAARPLRQPGGRGPARGPRHAHPRGHE